MQVRSFGFTLIALICLSLSSLLNAAEADKDQHLVVVELFTSQGCYSCPPADELLGEMANKPGVIAFACHVTYWDYLGWKDTFSQAFCDQRQRGYKDYMGRRSIYTPQMVINGGYQGVGSDRRLMTKLVQRLQQQPSVQAVDLAIDDGSLNIQLPGTAMTNPVQLWLLGVSGKHRLPIRSGENGGKVLNYYQPVLHAQSLGMWGGRAKSLQHPLESIEGVKQWVLLAQSTSLGPIVAAGSASVKVN